MDNEISHVDIRGIQFKLKTYNRSLKLCARMNYEIENMDFIDMIPKGEILYDLGACEGRFSIYAAKKGIETYAFEPDQYNYSVLEENIQLNQLESKLSSFKVGVGDKNDIVKMMIGQPWSGGHQKVVQYENYTRTDLQFDFVESTKIKLVVLDDFIIERQLPIPNYMKVDIDGSELPFLSGAKKTLSHSLMKGIIFELSIVDNNFDMIIDLLQELSFEEIKRIPVPNENNLYNFIFSKKK